MKVLYVGNDLELINHLNKEKKVTVIVKQNGLEAIKILNSNVKIDVIVSGYELTGNNGLFFYDKLKEENLAKIPFILLVKEYNQNIFKKAFQAGVNDFFVLTTTSKKQIVQRCQVLANQDAKIDENISKTKAKVPYKIPLSKRIFDVVVASSILIALSPFLLLIILAIRLESKGKVYYIAKRVGRKTFDFYKLRSMRTGSDKLLQQLAKEKNQYNKPEIKAADEKEECPRCSKLQKGESCSPLKYAEGNKICDYWYTKQKKQEQKNSSSFIKIVDDPRITKVGKIIRNTSIDELPQLINVIKGDMSLVGNRPLPVYEAELLTQDQMSKRFLAPAGITGLWQVELRGKGGDMSEEERIALDNRYADYFAGNNYSLWFDLKILMRTVPALFQKSTV